MSVSGRRARAVPVVGAADAAGSEEMRKQGQVELITYSARVFMPLAELVDLEQEKKRLQKELEQREKELAGLESRLNNPAFTSKAPESVVQGQRDRAEALHGLIAQLKESLASLG